MRRCCHFPVLRGVAEVGAGQRDLHVPGVRIGVPVGVDVDPGVERRQNEHRQQDHDREEVGEQSPYIAEENTKDVFHNTRSSPVVAVPSFIVFRSFLLATRSASFPGGKCAENNKM